MKEYHIRASSLTMFSDCPKRAMAKIIPIKLDKKWVKRNANQLTGTAAHLIVSEYLKNYGDSLSLKSLSKLEKLATASIESFFAGYEKDDIRIERGQKQKILSIAKNILVYLNDTFGGEIRYNHRKGTLLVEQGFERLLPYPEKDITLRLTGTIDLVLTDYSGNDRKIIFDYKSGTSNISSLAQMGAYIQLVRDFTIEDDRVEGIYLLASEKGVSSYYTGIIPTFHYTIEISNVVENIKKYEENVVNYLNIRENPHSVLCKKKYCDLYGSPFCTSTTNDFYSMSQQADMENRQFRTKGIHVPQMNLHLKGKE